MDKILEALSKLLPEDQLKEVSSAIAEMVEETKAELEVEFNKNLEEAYTELSEQLVESEKVAEDGYRQAWDFITDLRNRIEVMRAEYDSAIEEGYEEAYQAILAEKGKNENIETDLYEEYEKRFNESKGFLVDKIDLFLRGKGKEIYEMARRDIMSDPSMVEHKVVLDNIVEQVSGYITDEDRILATSSRLDETKKNLEDAQGRIRMLEAKNIRLSTENNKLNETVKQAAELINESTKSAVEDSKKARVEKAKKVTGRGEVVTENTKVVSEFSNTPKTDNTDNGDDTLVESMDPAQLHAMQVLAGTKNNY
jgi:rubrerythrin